MSNSSILDTIDITLDLLRIGFILSFFMFYFITVGELFKNLVTYFHWLTLQYWYVGNLVLVFLFRIQEVNSKFFFTINEKDCCFYRDSEEKTYCLTDLANILWKDTIVYLFTYFYVKSRDPLKKSYL